MGVEVFHALKNILKDKSSRTGVGDEGGFAPALGLQHGGARPAHGGDRARRLPARRRRRPRPRRRRQRVRRGRAARYRLRRESVVRNSERDGRRLRGAASSRYPIVSIEDGLAEDDWAGWALLTRRLGARVQLVGDDLFVTNPAIIQQGIQKGDRQRRARQGQPGRHADRDAARPSSWPSARPTAPSSRTAPARRKTPSSPTSPWRSNAGQIKTGSLARSERTAKYNQLLRIEEELGHAASWPGRSLYARSDR